MAKVGRPTKLTPQLQAEVMKALQIGMYLQDAADFAGIHKDTLFHWLEQGKAIADPKDPLRAFSDAVHQQRAQTKGRAVGLVHKAMAKDWKAAAWWLGVTDAKHYGPKVRVTLEQEFTDALARVRKRLPPEVYEQVLDAILEDGGGAGEGEAPPGEDRLEH